MNDVYQNLILDSIDDRYDYKIVILYGNKLVIKHDSGDMDIVIFKNISDGIRAYNLLMEKTKSDKLKQVLFIGGYGGKNQETKNLVEDIAQYTGWNKRKIMRHSTRA